MECNKCGYQSVKNGKSKIGIQRYRCKSCGNSFQSSYNYTSFMVSDDQIKILTKEGCGIRSTARILSISPNTVIRRIIKIGNQLKRPYLISKGSKYEVDELFTFVGKKTNRICIAYSLEPTTGFRGVFQLIAFVSFTSINFSIVYGSFFRKYRFMILFNNLFRFDSYNFSIF